LLASADRRHDGTMDDQITWTLEIKFTEDDRATRADIEFDVANRHLHGWGRAKRDPADPDVPLIGEEIAAGRALIRLAHQLLGAAENEIEEIEQHAVYIHT
jgi:Rv2632c-like